MPEDVKPWDAVFEPLRVPYLTGYGGLSKATAADLDATEQLLNFKFPLSYRTFVETFGLRGYLCCCLPQMLPLTPPPEDTHWSSSVVTATDFYHTYDWHGEQGQDEELPSSEFLKRVIIFAMDGSYHSWAFDPTEVTNTAMHEYRIYDIDRETHASLHANSFGEWLVRLRDQYTFEEEEDLSGSQPIDFFPNSLLPFKTPPAQADVFLWLASNNNTARDLALSIRDAGHTEAFPILADALQEADCTNADLLDACRTGDPDIDGKWVLQVLLGNA